MKTCRKCNKEQPLDEFYAHPKTADRHFNKCRNCTLEYQRSPARREYDKKRFKDNPKRREKILAAGPINRKRWPEKYKAHTLVNSAVRCGRLVRPCACPICGTTERRIEAHHADYSKPLDVVWCCTPCHRKLDGITKPLP